MKRCQILIFISVLMVIGSCNYSENYFKPEPECISDNKDDLEKENQKKWVAILQNKNPVDFRYFFKRFEEEGHRTYMIVNVRNEELCFDIRMMVNKWDKLAGMKRTQGVSYPKELHDLSWQIVSVNGENIVEYMDMRHIID